MAKDLKFFMRTPQEEIVTVPGPDTIKDADGNVIDLEVRVLPQARIREIQNNYRKRSIATDKKGNPLVANGEVLWKTEKDPERSMRHLIVEALVYPDLKNKQLMEFFNCTDVTDMPLRVFPRADEYEHVSRVVMTALGLIDTPDEAGVLEDAKN